MTIQPRSNLRCIFKTTSPRKVSQEPPENRNFLTTFKCLHWRSSSCVKWMLFHIDGVLTRKPLALILFLEGRITSCEWWKIIGGYDIECRWWLGRTGWFAWFKNLVPPRWNDARWSGGTCATDRWKADDRIENPAERRASLSGSHIHRIFEKGLLVNPTIQGFREEP